MKIQSCDMFTYSVIKTDDDIKELASLWKGLGLGDNDPKDYSQTNEEAVKIVVEAERGKAQLIHELKQSGKLPDIIVLDNHPITIMLTKDGYNGAQWHVSLAELHPMGFPISIDDGTATKLLNGFFKDWREIENPGMIKTIRHFVGND
jgi:hypothetical protein